jgi:hypothetical protein
MTATHMHTQKYLDYLQSPEWSQMRMKRILKAERCCEACRARPIYLEVHHLTYERLFREKLNDLIALCTACHQRIESFIKKGWMKRTGPVGKLRQKTLKILNPIESRRGQIQLARISRKQQRRESRRKPY